MEPFDFETDYAMTLPAHVPALADYAERAYFKWEARGSKARRDDIWRAFELSGIPSKVGDEYPAFRGAWIAAFRASGVYNEACALNGRDPIDPEEHFR